MQLNTKGRYAVTAMLDLALYAEARPVSLAAIAGRQDISLSYLEQLFVKLRRNELVRSIRGPGGGYQLSRNSSEIFIAEVIKAVDEKTDTTRCGGQSDCQHGDICLTHHLWHDLSRKIHQFLDNISLADLVAKREVQAVAARQLQRRERVVDDKSKIQLSSIFSD